MRVTSDWYSQVFLKSAYWRYVKAAVLDRDEHRCRFCGSTQNLHVHHLSYYFLDLLVAEKVNVAKYIPSDKQLESEMRMLITLCDICHDRYHKAKNNIARRIKQATDDYNEALMRELVEVFDQAVGDVSWANIRPAEIASALKADMQHEAKKMILKGTNVNKDVVPEVNRRRTMRLSKKRFKLKEVKR